MQDVLAVSVLVLHGGYPQIAAIAEAIEYLQSYETPSPNAASAVKFEIEVRYRNGSVIRGTYQNKNNAIKDLRRLTE